jgi:hypothetical protein
VRRAQRVNYLDGFGVVDFFGTEAASFVGVAANRRDDVRAAGARERACASRWTIKRLSFWLWLTIPPRRVLRDTFTQHHSLNWKQTR